MKEYIEELHSKIYQDFEGKGDVCYPPSPWDLMTKVNELIRYVNGLIDVGLLPYPDNYAEEEDDE